MGRLAVLGILSVAGAFLLHRDNLSTVFLSVGAAAVITTLATTPVMRKHPNIRWPYYALCVFDALALGVITAVSRGAESPFIPFMVAHAFVYGFYLGIPGGLTAAAVTTSALGASVAFSLLGPATAKSVMVGTLLEAGHLKLSANFLVAQVALIAGLFFASGAAGGVLGRMFYSEKGMLQRVIDNLAEVRARSRKVLENLSDGVVVVNAQGSLVQANPAATRMLGLSERQGFTLRGTVIESAITQFLAERHPPESMEMVVDESIIHCRFSPSDQGDGLIVVMSDITEAANLRAALEERKRLAIVGRLSATLAHEIRNPLASISGAAEMLASGKLPEGKSQRMTSIIVNQSKRVSELIDGYLSLARDSNDFPQNPIELGSFTADAVESAIHGYAGGVTISFRNCESPLFVLGNPTRLGQALGNMMRNAVEALSDQTLGVVEVELNGAGSEAVLSVSDNGPGIPPGRLDRVWEPFYTTRAEGTGLGLYVCRRIASEHRGRIELVNRNEGGLRASLVLPVIEEEHGGQTGHPAG